MATPVTMPKLGIVMVEGTVSRWLKPAGTEVKRGEPLVEIATDKITYEMEAPEDGVLHLVAEEGAVVPVDGLLAYLLATGETPPTEAPAAAPDRAAPTPEAVAPAAARPQPTEVVAEGRVLATPIARRIAAEHGLDLRQIRGTGPGGRIVREDVERARAERERAPTAAAPTRIEAPPPIVGPEGPLRVRERIRMSGMRRVIAERMMQSLATTAQVTLSTQAEATELVRIREQLSRLEERAGRPRVPYDALLVKIVARALQDYPILNSAVQGDEIVLFQDINIAVAVSVEEGLVAPVLRNVDAKPLSQINEELQALVERARSRSLTLDDLTGGTFGISNLGLYGIESFTPILIPPQTGILGVGAIAPRPVVVEGEVAVRQTMYLSLTFDHRVTDGVPAGRFLQRVRELIENPWLMFW